MTDKISKAQRSANMRAVRSRSTRPEILVRQIAHRLGYRFRLHYPALPGKPDIVFPGRQKAIFVHGCFWHQHEGCRRATVPKSNCDFWGPKLARNQVRDAEQLVSVRKKGWRVLVVWECEIKNQRRLAIKIKRFLGTRSGPDYPNMKRSAT
jgi:DNA mismatch endonuclease, patch repair protein